MSSLRLLCQPYWPADVVPGSFVYLDAAARGLNIIFCWPALSQDWSIAWVRPQMDKSLFGHSWLWPVRQPGVEPSDGCPLLLSHDPGLLRGRVCEAVRTMEDTGLQELVTAGGKAVYSDSVMSVNHGEPAPEDVTSSLGVGCPLHAQTSYALTLTSHHLLSVSPSPIKQSTTWQDRHLKAW